MPGWARSCVALRASSRRRYGASGSGRTHSARPPFVQSDWPAFKWSHDDRFIARLGKDKKNEDVISVYQVPEMTLLENKSIRVPHGVIGGIEWSPTDNILAYWVPEKDNTPAKVSLISLPSKEPVREIHLYSVSDVRRRRAKKKAHPADAATLVVRRSRCTGKTVATASACR
jgi:uncharacterized protein with WD repeat